MKKVFFIIIIAFSIVNATSNTCLAFDEEEQIFAQSVIIKLQADFTLINGEKSAKAETILKNNHVLVPIRFVAESFAAKVDWNKSKKEITVLVNDRTILLIADSKEMKINNETKLIDEPATIVNGTTYIPLRAIGESLNKQVHYSEDDKIIYIYDDSSSILSTGSGPMLTKLLFDSKNVLYYDHSVIFYRDNNKVYMYGSFQNKIISIEDQADFHTYGDKSYFITSIVGPIVGLQAIYGLYENDVVKCLSTTYISEYIIDDAGEFIYITEGIWGNVLLEPELRKSYAGNLCRLNLTAFEGGQESSLQYLGMPGFVYGCEPTYQDESHPGEDGAYQLFSKSFKPILQDGYIYINGVEFLEDMSKAEPGYAYYKIPLTGRNHERIGAPHNI